MSKGTNTSKSEREELDVLRSGELPLGTLTLEEKSWLTSAFAQLNRIYDKRGAGRAGDSPFCIFEIGNVFVQFLAPWNAEVLLCEAVSAKSNPEIAAVLTSEGDAALRRLGFEAPEISPNYSQTIKIEGVADLAYAARLGLRVLKQVYRVTDFSSASFKITIPTLKNVLQQFLNGVEWKAEIGHNEDRNTYFVGTGFEIDGQSYRLVLIADENFKELSVMLTSPIRIPKHRAKEATFVLNFLNVHMRRGHFEMGENGEVRFNWVISVEGATASPAQFGDLVSAANYAFNENNNTTIGAAAFSKQSAEDIIEELKEAWKKPDEKSDDAPSAL